MGSETALLPGYGGDLVSTEDITGVTPLVGTTTSGTGTVGTTSFSLGVASTTGFATSGWVWLLASNVVGISPPGPLVLVQYTGTSGGNTFTGCTVDAVTNSLGTSEASPTWGSGALVAQASVKMPRSKIARGASGTDGGDITPTNPLPIAPYKDFPGNRSFLGFTYTNTASATTTTVTVLTTLVENSGNTASTGVTAFAVPGGDTLTITTFSAAAVAVATSTSVTGGAQCVYVDIRVATTNTTTALATAPIVATIALPLNAYQANTTNGPAGGMLSNVQASFGDGIQVPGGSYVGITVHNAVTTIATVLHGMNMTGYVRTTET